MKWREATLQDLVVLQRGFDITRDQQRAGDVPVISSSGITSFHNEAKVDGPGVVIGRKGSLGTTHYSEGPYWPHDTTLWSKDLKGNSARYVFYFLQTLGLQQFNVGNANPTLNRNHIHGLGIRIPPLDVQQRIVDSLSAYDDLIENNRRRIQLLEESARLLYREWFIHLRFPGHEYVRVVDGVPTGWSRFSIGELTSYLNRGIAPKYDDDALGLVINQKCVRNRLLNLDLARRQSKEVPAEKLVKFGDVLINSTGEGTLGRVAQVISDITNCTVDSHVTIARPNDRVGTFQFGMSLCALESVLTGMGRGATNQTELSRSDVAALELLVPNKSVGDEFEAFAKSVFQQIACFDTQNKKLAQARDLLIPRLMSGAIQP